MTQEEVDEQRRLRELSLQVEQDLKAEIAANSPYVSDKQDIAVIKCEFEGNKF